MTDAGVKVTTFVPMRIVRHKTNRIIVQPGANGENTTRATVDATLLKALARGLYWQQLLDTGRVANIAELAAVEGLEKVRLQKTLKLARLSPDMVEGIASGRDPVGLSFEFFIRHGVHFGQIGAAVRTFGFKLRRRIALDIFVSLHGVPSERK